MAVYGKLKRADLAPKAFDVLLQAGFVATAIAAMQRRFWRRGVLAVAIFAPLAVLVWPPRPLWRAVGVKEDVAILIALAIREVRLVAATALELHSEYVSDERGRRNACEEPAHTL